MSRSVTPLPHFSIQLTSTSSFNVQITSTYGRMLKSRRNPRQQAADLVAEIREKDRERIVFFRQMHELGNLYAWKSTRHSNGRPNKRANLTTGRNVLKGNGHHSYVSKHSMVPFPSIWMDSVFRVRCSNRPKFLRF